MQAELQHQILSVQQDLATALTDNDIDLAGKRLARLKDLVDLATRHGVDVSAWVDRDLLERGSAAVQ